MDTGLGTVVVFGVLTFIAFASILATALVRLWKSPLVIRVDAPINVPPIKIKCPIQLPPIVIQMPERMLVQSQVVPSDLEIKAPEVPIPVEILEYIEIESEVFARDMRKRRVRQLFAETGNWDAAFRMLQNEDNPLKD